MSKPASTSTSRPVESIVLVRALAIMLVVANHAFPIALHGGMNTLLVVSGMAMAQFAFVGTTRDSLRSFFRFGARVVIPSLVVASLWALYTQKVNPYELALVSNWMTAERISLFPIWYTQTITQLLLVLGVVFAATDMTRRIRQNRLFWTLTLYGIAVGIAAVGTVFWNPPELYGQLPHLLAWQFVFGWVCWAVISSSMSYVSGRLLLTVLLVGSSLILLYVFGTDREVLRFPVLVTLIMVLIWIDRINLPAWLAKGVFLVSQATLFIFLLHRHWFDVVRFFVSALDLPGVLLSPVVMMVAGIVGSVLTWVLWTAMLRVYRRGYSLAASA